MARSQAPWPMAFVPRWTALALFIAGVVINAGPAGATVFTSASAFDSAVAAAGIALTTDNFPGPIGTVIPNGGTLGQFTYAFDPANNKPGIASDGMGGHALGDLTFGTDPNSGTGVFAGGSTLTWTKNGSKLLAFGADFSYAPAFEDPPGGLYLLTLKDGSKANTTAGSPAGLSGAGGSFFLGFIVDPGSDFSQILLSSLTDTIDLNGIDFLTPAFQVNDVVLGPGAAALPEPASLPLLAANLAVFAALASLARVRRRQDRIRDRHPRFSGSQTHPKEGST